MTHTEPEHPQIVAAVDLGSNSFHMKVARFADGRLDVVDRLKEMVRLAAGLDENDSLDPQAMARALECLGRFGERLRDVPSHNVRVVGTNTLRRASNAAEFLRSARKALGHHVEVISGIEEARLIYLGVVHNVPLDDSQRLVIDIGGGSTEVIIGRGFEPLHMESLYAGCVSASRKHFPDGLITRDRMDRCALDAMQEFEPLQTPYRQAGWDTAYGSSGTAINVARVLGNVSKGDGVTLTGLHWLRDAMIDIGRVDKLEFAGLQPERASVFAGGVAILLAAFEVLGIERLEPAGGALREGILYDLLGRFGSGDVREATIRDLIGRFRIDVDQARRVEATALALYEQVADTWNLQESRHEILLRWAADLHELGFAIVHAQYHKHGAYLIQHADLPGFSQQEQALLAGLVRAHRRKFPQRVLEDLPIERAQFTRLAALLRIAVLLHRSRSDVPLPQLNAQAHDDDLTLAFPQGWLQSHPLSQADLEQECDYLQAAGIRLRLR